MFGASFDLCSDEMDELYMSNRLEIPFFPGIDMSIVYPHVVEEMPLGDPTKSKQAKNGADKFLNKLSSDEQELVRHALAREGGETEVLVQIEANSVQRKSLKRLIGKKWIDDEAVTFWFKLLAQEDYKLCKKDTNRKGSAFFTSFFATKLLNEGNHVMDGEYSYRNVSNWASKLMKGVGGDIFEMDKIFFPFNCGRCHWVCAVVDMKRKTIFIVDPMGGNHTRYLQHLFRYLQDEHKIKKGSPLPEVEKWRVMHNSVAGGIPLQENGYDCGVFTCMFAYFLLMDFPLVFTQEHINESRKWMVLSILKQQILPKISALQEEASSTLQEEACGDAGYGHSAAAVVTPRAPNYVDCDLTQDD